MPILSTSLATGLAGLLSLGASPIAAVNAPVTVVSCDYSSQWLPRPPTGIPESASFQGGNLRISFVNQAPLTATNVRFAVHYAGRTQIVDDAGTFSTGRPSSKTSPRSPTPARTAPTARSAPSSP